MNRRGIALVAAVAALSACGQSSDTSDQVSAPFSRAEHARTLDEFRAEAKAPASPRYAPSHTDRGPCLAPRPGQQCLLVGLSAGAPQVSIAGEPPALANCLRDLRNFHEVRPADLRPGGSEYAFRADRCMPVATEELPPENAQSWFDQLLIKAADEQQERPWAWNYDAWCRSESAAHRLDAWLQQRVGLPPQDDPAYREQLESEAEASAMPVKRLEARRDWLDQCASDLGAS